MLLDVCLSFSLLVIVFDANVTPSLSLLFFSAISRGSLLPLHQWHPGDPLVSWDPLSSEFSSQPEHCKRPHSIICTRHDSVQHHLRLSPFQVPPTQRKRGLAADQCSGCRLSSEPAGCGCPSGAHQHGDLLQLGGGAMPAVPDPRGPSSAEALAPCSAHGGVAPPLPGLSLPQSACGGGEAVGHRQGAWAAAGSAEEAGGEGEGADCRAQAAKEGYSHPAVAARPTNHQQPQGTVDTTRYRWQAKRFLFEGYWSCLNLIYVWQQTSTPTLFFPLRRPKSVIVPETYSHLWLCAFHNRVSREKWKAFSMAQGNSQLWKQLLCPNHSQVLIIFVFMQEKSDLKLLSRWCQLVAISVFFFNLKRKANPSAISSHVCECCPCRLFITEIKKSFLSSSGEQLALTWLGCSQGNRYSVSWEHVVARCALEAQLTELVQLLIARPCACVLWGPLLLWCHISTTWTHTAVFED